MNPATSKGVWQVRPVQNGWDHADLIGLDLLISNVLVELGKYYLGMINNMMRVEELDGLTKNNNFIVKTPSKDVSNCTDISNEGVIFL